MMRRVQYWSWGLSLNFFFFSFLNHGSRLWNDTARWDLYLYEKKNVGVSKIVIFIFITSLNIQSRITLLSLIENFIYETISLTNHNQTWNQSWVCERN